MKPDDNPQAIPADTTFEKALERLEAIVGEMESGRLPLDDALCRFEEGSRLAAFCSAKLDEAERKIEILARKADGAVERRPFEQDAAESGQAEHDGEEDETADDEGEGDNTLF